MRIKNKRKGLTLELLYVYRFFHVERYQVHSLKILKDILLPFHNESSFTLFFYFK